MGLGALITSFAVLVLVQGILQLTMNFPLDMLLETSQIEKALSQQKIKSHGSSNGCRSIAATAMVEF